MPALEEGYFNVDEMAFEDLLAMAADQARHLQFFPPPSASTVDNWEAFFTSDDAVIIAMILATDLGNMQADFFNAVDRNVSQFGDGYDLTNIPSYALATKIDFWFDQMRSSIDDAGRNLSKRMGEIIVGTLRDELLSLETFLGNFGIFQQKFRNGFTGPWFASGDNSPTDQAATTQAPSPITCC